MEYEYVRAKTPLNIHTLRRELTSFLFGNPAQFVWNMIGYHILILAATFSMGIEIPAKVMLKLGMGDVAAVNAEMQSIGFLQSSITNILFLAIILFLDFALLLIIKSELNILKNKGKDNLMGFKLPQLTIGKILLLEVPIFILGLWNPFIRTGLFFFSANTLQIAIAYKWFIKKWTFFQYFFIAGSYILILRLLWFIVAYLLWGAA